MVTVLVLGVLVLFCFRLFLSVRLRSKQGPDLRNKPNWLRRVFILCILGTVNCIVIVVGSDIYSRKLPIFQDAKQALDGSSVARSDLGESIKIGWPIRLDFKASSVSGYARLALPVYGTLDKGVLYVMGTKSDGVWKVDEMFLIRRGGTVRESLQPAEPTERPAP